MAAKYYRATVSIPADTGLPRDTVQNTWAFKNVTTALLLADSSAIDVRLSAFYTTIGPVFSSSVDLSGARLSIVDYTDTAPRIPFYDEPITIAGATTSNNNLPQDVAFCLSFKQAPASGVRAARQRGRVYLGPLQVSTGDYELNTSTFTDLVAQTAHDEILDANDDLVWCVYSEATHRGVPVGANANEKDPITGDDVYPELPLQLANAFKQIDVVWCDNEFDTQRRRGLTATYRKTLP